MIEKTQEFVESVISSGVHASKLLYLHACPICSNPQLQHYCRTPSAYNKDEFIHYERCISCGTVIRNPRPLSDFQLWAYENRVFTIDEKRKYFKPSIHYIYLMRLINRFYPEGRLVVCSISAVVLGIFYLKHEKLAFKLWVLNYVGI